MDGQAQGRGRAILREALNRQGVMTTPRPRNESPSIVIDRISLRPDVRCEPGNGRLPVGGQRLTVLDDRGRRSRVIPSLPAPPAGEHWGGCQPHAQPTGQSTGLRIEDPGLLAMFPQGPCSESPMSITRARVEGVADRQAVFDVLAVLQVFGMDLITG